MSKLVVINLGFGDLQSGCPNITAQVSQAVGDSPREVAKNRYATKCSGGLPPAPQIDQLYRHWQLLYREFYRERSAPPTRAITIEPGGVTHFSEIEFSDLSKRLKLQINAWLNSESFLPIDRKLSRELDPTDEVRVIIETNDNSLRQIPWHLWNFFEDYPRAEVALSVQEYGRVTPQSQTPVGSVRILAVLGDQDGINLQSDRKLLEVAPDAVSMFLEEPYHWELDEHLWDQKGWDILFFAGHSQTEEDTGRIYINPTESLTLKQLRNALRTAISRGLKLVIFNSCDGLGLAQSLADLHIPQVIVMRELVPDVVAQEFFKHFLSAFSQGKSLYAAVREARERLEKLEDDFPCATWLPIICQNPSEEPTTWRALCGSLAIDRLPATRKQRLQILLLASAIVTAFVIGVRQLGTLQNWELQSFDQLMRLRPAESPDPRLLVVTITEKDVQSQNPQERRGSSLSDRTLAQLLEKLQTHQARVIGLDVYRDFPITQNHANLKTNLQNENLIEICEVGDSGERSGTRHPPDVSEDRLSFSDFPIDSDGVVRRQLLAMAPNPNSLCVTDISFSLRVAQSYLLEQNIQVERDSQGEVRIGRAIFKQLEPQTGGYQKLDDLGYQVLLNYRSSKAVSAQVTLTDLFNLSEAELSTLIKDRIVLIGTTAQSFKDYSPTPYSSAQGSEQMPGVMIHAHMVSQVISAVLDQRPLLWWLPPWGVTLWVGAWSLVGGVLVLWIRSPLRLGLASSAALGTLVGVCFIVLPKGGWMPLIPAALSLVATGGSVVAYTVYQNRNL
ncbi:MAG: CHASE2 domain-containing protein [Leptolyngbyaceae cyanobacterium CSU_1_3]|nr:CHASE2 domain-containing protein [Leptolyngbyaceae cyanobacterium CSU_1_3]